MKLLITGASGYIGGRLCQYLYAADGYDIRATDIRHPDELPARKFCHEYVKNDLLHISGQAMGSLCSNIDCVVHLAALNENDCLSDPVRAAEINTIATLRLLAAAAAADVKRFIYISTAHVYGSPLDGFLDEYTLCRPVHPYAITHKAAEDFVYSMHVRKKIETVIVRLSNAFGVPANSMANRWTLLVNDLCRQTVETGVIRLRSQGRQKRDFVPLSDAVQGIEHLLQLQQVGAYPVYNLGSGESITVYGMAERIAARSGEILGYMPEISLDMENIGEVNEDLIYCIDKIKEAGFLPKGNMDAEIDRTLIFCRDNFKRFK